MSPVQLSTPPRRTVQPNSQETILLPYQTLRFSRSYLFMLIPFYHLGKAVSEPPYSRSAWKRNSRKFGVASDPLSSAPNTRERHGGTTSGRFGPDLVGFVAPSCIKGLRLVTAQLPEKFSPVGLGTN
jgi:hypothetical protein